MSTIMFEENAGIEANEFPYRSVSRLAVLSMVLIVFGTLGLMPGFEWMLAASFLGAVFGVLAFLRIRAYPNEFAGLPVAILGGALNACLLLGGIGKATYIYLTEVPEGYTRVEFASLESAKNAPDVPTQVAMELNGQQVFLKGYVHSASGDGRLRKFILVPDLGTCCFGGQPNSTSMIEVTLTGNQTVTYQLKRFKLAGVLKVDPFGGLVEGFQRPIYYRMQADMIR